MKKDIEFPKVEGVSVGIVLDEVAGEKQWNAYLINRKKSAISSVLINASGYGEINGETKKTSTLRYFFESVPPESAVLIEMISDEVFALSNEYWVSYYEAQTIYDKKFIFLPESILEQNFTKIPILEKRGVLIA